jgi:hypothetical protein
MKHFLCVTQNLAHFVRLNPCFLLVYCSGKLYGRAAVNFLECTQVEHLFLNHF